MPKIIKDIESKIFETAKEVFSSKGYKEADMKTISKKCNIAVGTLYNYYPNKKMLYIDVFLKSWNITIKKLKEIEKNDNRNDELMQIINVFYSDVESRNGLGNDLKELWRNGDEELDKMVETVFIQIIAVIVKRFEIKDEFKNMPNIEAKIMLVLFTGICVMKNDFRNSRKDNIIFLYSTVSNYFKI
ncbi:MAG: TetR/AcrR family transcriptional regulator [Sarcina sp.]